MQWYYRIGDQTEGPVDDAAMQELVRAGRIGRQDLVWHERMGEQWVPLHQFPALAALSPETRAPNPEREAELRRQQEQADRDEARRRMTVRAVTLVVVVGLVGATVAAVYAKKTAPSRALGISKVNPLGTLERLDRLFTQEFQMDRLPASACPGIDRTAPTMCTYTNPKAARGKYVSGGGSITVLADGQRVMGIGITYTTPGARGGTFYDVSVCSLWAEKFWRLFQPGKEKTHRSMADLPTGTWERTGFSGTLPRNGWLAIHEDERIRGWWYEYNPHGLRTTMFLEVKDAPPASGTR